MDKFNFSIRTLVTWLLPPHKRKPKRISWITALCAYFSSMQVQFLSWGAEKKEELSWNCQTIVLRNLLVLKFGEGIWIENILRPEVINITFPYANPSNPRNYSSYEYTNSLNRITYPYGSFDPELVSFIVWVPDSLIYSETKMRAYLDKYKLVGTNYSIQTYTL